MFGIPVTIIDFYYASLFRDHLVTASFGLLAFTLISFYIVKNPLLRGIIVFLAIVLGWHADVIDEIAIPIIVAFGALFYCAYGLKNKWIRGFFFLVTLGVSLALMLLDIPGVHNFRVIDHVKLTPDAIPYSMTFTFDKSLIGLFFLWFAPYTLANGGKWIPSLKTGLIYGIYAIFVLIPLSHYLGYVKLDFKFGDLFYLWAINNLLFVCIAEEALFRGMIQKFLMIRLSRFSHGRTVALVITAALFGLVHFPGGIKYVFLSFIAGLIYGYAFIKTEKIETSIVTHFMVNTVHFLIFTYPALASELG